MHNELINLIKNVCLKHKDIKVFKYQDSLLTNTQGQDKSLQAIVDDTVLYNLLISRSPNVLKASLDLYIIGFVKTDDTILNVQTKAYDAAMQIIYKIGDIAEYKGIVDIEDYSIMTISHYTDDDSCGVKVSLDLLVPFGFCDIDDYFNEEIEEEEEPKDITLNTPSGSNKEIKLNPIVIPKNNKKHC